MALVSSQSRHDHGLEWQTNFPHQLTPHSHHVPRLESGFQHHPTPHHLYRFLSAFFYSTCTILLLFLSHFPTSTYLLIILESTCPALQGVRQRDPWMSSCLPGPWGPYIARPCLSRTTWGGNKKTKKWKHYAFSNFNCISMLFETKFWLAA